MGTTASLVGERYAILPRNVAIIRQVRHSVQPRADAAVLVIPAGLQILIVQVVSVQPVPPVPKTVIVLQDARQTFIPIRLTV